MTSPAGGHTMRLHKLLVSTGVFLAAFSVAQADSDFDEIDSNPRDGVITASEWDAALAKPAKPKFPPAVAAAPSVPPSTAPENAEKSPGLIPWLERHVLIRKSFFNDKSINDPAKINWTKSKGEDAFYNLDLAILWKDFVASRRIAESKTFEVYFSSTPFFETHISNQADTHEEVRSQDALLWGVPFTFNFLPRDPPVSIADIEAGRVDPPKHFVEGHSFSIIPQYRMDRLNDIRAFEVAAAYTPLTVPALNIGVSNQLFGLAWLQFRWRPFLGFEVGRYLDGNELVTPNEPEDYSRFFARVHAELEIIGRLALVTDYTWRKDLRKPNQDHHYSEISLVVALDQDREVTTLDGAGKVKEQETVPAHFSVGITWKRGEDAPIFKDTDLFTAWLGTKF